MIGKQGARTFEKIIIVNFPQYAGRIIDGVPIADFNLFLSYFHSGKLTSLKLEKGKKAVFDYIHYYDSVESFEINFRSFFMDSVPISELINRQEIQEYEVSYNGTEPKIIAERVLSIPKNY